MTRAEVRHEIGNKIVDLIAGPVVQALAGMPSSARTRCSISSRIAGALHIKVSGIAGDVDAAFVHGGDRRGLSSSAG